MMKWSTLQYVIINEAPVSTNSSYNPEEAFTPSLSGTGGGRIPKLSVASLNTTLALGSMPIGEKI
jgi:hypothetical protein